MSQRKGILFVISAPSGAGKSTLCQAVRDRFPDLRYSVSHTTRKPRPGERDGVDYYFISEAEFRRRAEAGDFAEWAVVHGNHYGTARAVLDGFRDAGQDVILDIDVQGGRQIMAAYPEAVTVFIMPPSIETLKSRIESRGTDAPGAIETRLGNAVGEMSQRHRYRHVILNDRLPEAVDALIRIVAEARDPGPPST